MFVIVAFVKLPFSTVILSKVTFSPDTVVFATVFVPVTFRVLTLTAL